MVCRDESIRGCLQKDLKDTFPDLYSIELDEDVNVAMCCLAPGRTGPAPGDSFLLKSFKEIEEVTQKSRRRTEIDCKVLPMFEDIMKTVTKL